MILLWTKNKLPGSKLIRWGLSEDVSHFACAFFVSKDKGLVVHQKLHGFSIDWLPKWRDKNDVVFSLKPKEADKERDRKILHGIMNRFYGTRYDALGFLYFTWRAFLYKFFGVGLPVKNKWSEEEEPLCTGIAKILQDAQPLWFFRSVRDFDIVTPQRLFNNMRSSGQFDDATIFDEG